MSGIGFLVGYFVMYSIRAGSKTQDAFKSFFGAGGLAGGAFFAQNARVDLALLETSVFHGAEAYIFAAVVLGFVYAYSNSECAKDAGGGDTGRLAGCRCRLNTLAVTLGRILLGEDFRAPASK